MPGWKPLIVCNGTSDNPCTYEKLVELARVLIHDLVILSTFLAVIVFMYAGFKLLTSGGDEGALKGAKKMFTKVGIGYLWILAAWVIVYTISKALLKVDFIFLTA